jgi:hypothetical protein
MKPSTYERIDKVGSEIAYSRKTRTVSFDDVLNELVEVYETNT